MTAARHNEETTKETGATRETRENKEFVGTKGASTPLKAVMAASPKQQTASYFMACPHTQQHKAICSIEQKPRNRPILQGKTMLVLGATSEIAQATIDELIPQGWCFHLTGRNLPALQRMAENLARRSGKTVAYSYFDAVHCSLEQTEQLWLNVLLSCGTKNTQQEPCAISTTASSDSASATLVTPALAVEPTSTEADVNHTAATTNTTATSLDELDCSNSSLQAIYCAIGLLEPQDQVEQSCVLTQTMLQANFTGLIPLLTLAANYFEAQKRGHMLIISSVAGERGRRSNYVYGATKAGLTAFLSGLRVRLHQSGVQVLTILPGLVKTKMIAQRKVPAILTATPQTVARDIVKALNHNQSVLYTPWYWRYIMWVVKHIPECIYIRLHRL